MGSKESTCLFRVKVIERHLVSHDADGVAVLIVFEEVAGEKGEKGKEKEKKDQDERKTGKKRPNVP